ncbi:MAG: acyltransferase [Bacteroidia bacterium]
MAESPISIIKHSTPFYIKGFDGLRALSIIMVMLTHLGAYDVLLRDDFTQRIWHSISGDVGVNIFFVISGFLITTLLLREKLQTGKISYRNFIIRRFLRLLPPLVFLYFIIFVLMITSQIDYRPYALFASIFYCYNFLPNKFGLSELSHTWSLAVEEQFYIFWPWVVLLFRKNGILITALLFILLALITINVIPGLEILYQNEIHLFKDVFKTHRFFLPAIAPIMIGSVFAVFNFHDNERLKNIVCQPLSMLIAMVLILSAFIIPLSLFQYLFIIQAMGFAMILSYIFNKQNSLLADFLEWKPLSFIGKISYGIYVWQGLFLRTGTGGELWIQNPPQNILLTFIVAVTSYYLIEKRVMKWKLRFKSSKIN